jgi:serine protease inhibitor
VLNYVSIGQVDLFFHNKYSDPYKRRLVSLHPSAHKNKLYLVPFVLDTNTRASVVSHEYYSKFQSAMKYQEKIQKKVPRSSSALRNTLQSLVRKVGTVNSCRPISCNVTELGTNVSVACFVPIIRVDEMDASTTSSNVTTRVYVCLVVERLEATACSKTQTS